MIVEHTAINPNKAAHIGHLRNAALGDTLVRALRFLGHPVEIQNYIDDTGVQVADVVVGFRHLESRRAADVEALAREPRFDYYCWDLYAKVTGWYDEDKERLAVRAATLHEIERGEGEAAAIGRIVADRIVRCHLRTMARLNVQYDLLTWEGDILRLQFWNKAFERLKAQGTVYFQDGGRLAGCWVMRIEDGIEHALEGGARRRRGGWVRSRGRRRRGRGRRRPGREGHRALERDRDLRRQGHGLPVLEVRPARRGLPLSPVRRSRARTGRSGRRRLSPRPRKRPSGRRSAAATRSTT